MANRPEASGNTGVLNSTADASPSALIHNHHPTDDRRAKSRFRYASNGCVLHINRDGGATSVWIPITPSDISDGGMRFQMASFVRPMSVGVIQILTNECKWEHHAVEVVRCEPTGTDEFDVGIKFHTVIGAGRFTHANEPYRILVVDRSNEIYSTVEEILTELFAIVISVDDPGESGLGRALRESRYDLVILFESTREFALTELVKRIRESGHHGVTALLDSQSLRIDRRSIREAGCDTVLNLPLVSSHLVELLECARKEPLVSSLAFDHQVAMVVNEFIEALPVQIAEIHAALSEDKIDGLRKACNRLAEESGCFGFPLLSQAAADIGRANRDQVDLDELIGRLSRLARRVRPTS